MARLENDISILFNRNIVVVEDDLSTLEYYTALYKRVGANVISFQKGKDFIKYADENSDSIDLIIMDFLIPEVTGIDCVRHLRLNDKHIPVILITAYYTEKIKQDAYIAGCNDYLLKPVFKENLYTISIKYMAKKLYQRSYSV